VTPELEAVLRAAIEVADAAFINQRPLIGGPLHQPIQRLIEALAREPEIHRLRKLINDEMRAQYAPPEAPDRRPAP
jgi:hypothetical protein